MQIPGYNRLRQCPLSQAGGIDSVCQQQTKTQAKELASRHIDAEWESASRSSASRVLAFALTPGAALHLYSCVTKEQPQPTWVPKARMLPLEEGVVSKRLALLKTHSLYHSLNTSRSQIQATICLVV